MAAVELSQSAARDVARERLEELWRSLNEADAFHRCIVAHYLADLQPDPDAELLWDRLALEAALSGDPTSFEGRIPGVEHGSFLPSLYLNLAASHERVGQLAEAKQHAAAALQVLDKVVATPLGELTRGAVLRVCQRLGVHD